MKLMRPHIHARVIESQDGSQCEQVQPMVDDQDGSEELDEHDPFGALAREMQLSEQPSKFAFEKLMFECGSVLSSQI